MEAKLGRPCIQFLVRKWIPEVLETGEGRFNVLLADFVDHLDFCKEIVQFNYREVEKAYFHDGREDGEVDDGIDSIHSGGAFE